MISERTFASSFSDFWAELLPLLTPSHVHMIGSGFRHSLTDRSGAPLDAIPKNSEVRDYTVVAEFAFLLSRRAFEGHMTVSEAFHDDSCRATTEELACSVLSRYEAGHGDTLLPLSRPELGEGLALAEHYELFLATMGHLGKVQFAPPIPGAGFLSACEGDLSIGRTLFEVKTVDRNVAGKDIRQLVTYLALQAASGKRRWNYAGFFNPRRAVYQRFRVDQVITEVSGGRSSAEVFRDLIDFVCTTDVQTDYPF